METTRQNKIARLIQKELSDIFQKQTSAMRGVLVSVSVCRISPDLSQCRVYLSVFPSEKAEEIVQNINTNQRQVRYELGTRASSLSLSSLWTTAWTMWSILMNSFTNKVVRG